MKISPSKTAALLVPLGIGLSFVTPVLLSSATAFTVRMPMVLAILSGICIALFGAHLYKLEWRWVSLLSLYILLNLVACFTVTSNSSQSFFDLGRQFFIAIFSIGLMLVLRRQETRLALYKGAAFAASIGLALIMLLYLQQYGFSLQLSSLDNFKYLVVERYGLPLNPLSFATTLCALLSFPLWRQSRLVAGCGVSAILVSLVLSGSRTSLVSFLLTIVLFLAVVFVRRLAPPLRLASLSVLIGTSVIGFANLSLSGINIDPTKASEVTTGRLDLWVAAWQKFLERPLFGWGAYTWNENLSLYLPGYAYYSQGLIELEAGAFHNMYLTVLAEKGLLVFTAAMLLLVTLLSVSWSVYDKRSTLPELDGRSALVAPFLVFLLLVRGLGEQPGLFGYASGSVDFLSYVIAASIFALANAHAVQGFRSKNG